MESNIPDKTPGDEKSSLMKTHGPAPEHPALRVGAIIDKTFPFCLDGENIAGKDCGLICCCAEEDMSVMDGVWIPIERTATLLKWHMVGEVLIPGV